jgi:hypothetical protein
MSDESQSETDRSLDQVRAENPGMAYREIAKKLKNEHVDFPPAAREKCRDESAKAGR